MRCFTNLAVAGVLIMGLHVQAPAQESGGGSGTAANGPSLNETMQFIQSKLSEWAHVRYTVSLQGNGADQAITYDRVSVSQDQCDLSFTKHVKSYSGINNAGQESNVSDVNYKIDLKRVASINYAPFAAGTPLEGVAVVWPLEVPSLHIGFNDGASMKGDGGRLVAVKDINIVFPMDQLADRFAKALNHAVTFCRGNPVVYQDLAARSEQERERLLAENDERVKQLEQKQAQQKAQMDTQSAANFQVTQSNRNMPDGNSGQEGSSAEEQISELRSDIQVQEQAAENDDSSAEQVLNNCSGGPGAAICQAIGQAGAARLRQKAAQARNQADEDREQIARLQGEEVQAQQRRDTTYGGNLQQVVTENGTSIQNTAAQQQANLAAMAAQRQQQAHTVAPSANSSTQISYGTQQPSYSPPSTSPGTSATTASPQQGQCTDMTNFVSGRAEVKGNEVIGWLTNNSGQDLYVSYTFAVNGVPSTSMANAGGGSLYAGKTNGGEGAGMYTYSADTNPGRIYWYAVPLAQKNANGCVHTW